MHGDKSNILIFVNSGAKPIVIGVIGRYEEIYCRVYRLVNLVACSHDRQRIVAQGEGGGGMFLTWHHRKIYYLESPK